MINYSIENKRKKLIFRSGHRGTKEMDLIMGGFAASHVSDFSPEELSEYENLLNENDPDLYNWIIGKENVPENIATMSVFKKLVGYKLI